MSIVQPNSLFKNKHVQVYRCGMYDIQGDHWSGKSGNTREFDSYLGNVKNSPKVWEMLGRKWKNLYYYFVTLHIRWSVQYSAGPGRWLLKQCVWRVAQHEE